jgi:hypothetical protein
MTELQTNDLLKYKSHKKCKVCSTILDNGEEARTVLEKMRVDGFTYVQTIEFAGRHGLRLTDQNLANHFKKHAPYCKAGNGISKKTFKHITQLTHSSEEATSALRKIITIGSLMIDNWWEGNRDQPQMPVTGKLFMDALKEEGKRSAKTVLDAEFETLQRQAIEGEVANDTIDSTQGQITS